jgi:hypothetical protein
VLILLTACVTDEVMEKAARYSTAGGAEEKGKAISLMKAAKQFSAGMSDASARDGEIYLIFIKMSSKVDMVRTKLFLVMSQILNCSL